jgi:hypothetical protein
MHRLGLAELNGEVGLTKRERDGVQWLTRAAELADQVDPPQAQSLHESIGEKVRSVRFLFFQARRSVEDFGLTGRTTRPCSSPSWFPSRSLCGRSFSR